MFWKDLFSKKILFLIVILDKILNSFSFLKTKKIIELFKKYLFVISLKLYFSIFSYSFFIVFKLVDLQISKGDYYINISENREFKNIEIPANRGNIYSDSGELLASSVPKYTIRFDALAPTDRIFEQNINPQIN